MAERIADQKLFPFAAFIVNPAFFIPTAEDFVDLFSGDGFFFDESEEALSLMSEADLQAIAEMEKAFS